MWYFLDGRLRKVVHGTCADVGEESKGGREGERGKKGVV